ncbi:MAG: esterase [Vitreoscilla sp.]|nr:esterase [Vitreoscilla sp.]MBP6675919.1 esterase [Vitreoscilla sp.]
METPTHVLYLHGFRSSPQSAKARQVAAWMQAHRPDVVWSCPQLPPSPQDALRLLMTLTADWPKNGMAVIGSSLGGFYATVLAERLGSPAALLNPAVNPARDLAKHLGEQSNFHNPEDRFFFRDEFIAELQTMTPAAITRPQRYFAVIAKGDEVLDWCEMHARYAGAHIRLLEGSDHALSNFDADLPHLLHFLQLTNEKPPCV